MKPRHMWLVALLAAGCSEVDAEAPEANRSFRTGRWQPLWELKGGDAGAPFEHLSGMAVDGESVYLADAARGELLALSLRDGSLHWRADLNRPGDSGGIRPIGVFARPDGGVAVSDQGRQEIEIFDARGKREGSVRLAMPFLSPAMCVLADGSFLVGNGAMGKPFVHLDRGGRVLRELSVDIPGVERSTPIQTQSVLASARGGRACVAALRVGAGFFYFDASAFGPMRTYVEKVRPARTESEGDERTSRERLVRGTSATTAVASSGDTLAVLFMGRSPHAGRVLDFYALRDGRYLHSVEAPFTAKSFASAGDVYLFLGMRMGYPVLLAARYAPAP